MRKLFCLTAVALLLSAPVHAQQSPVTLHLTIDEINTLIGSAEGKWHDLNPVIQDILSQTNNDIARQKALADAEAAAKAKAAAEAAKPKDKPKEKPKDTHEP